VTAHHSAATELGSNDVDGWKIKYLEAGTDTTTKTGDAGAHSFRRFEVSDRRDACPTEPFRHKSALTPAGA
jgi:hypothetical protein